MNLKDSHVAFHRSCEGLKLFWGRIQPREIASKKRPPLKTGGGDKYTPHRNLSVSRGHNCLLFDIKK